MEVWILFAKINFCLAVFAAGYQFLFRALTFHRFNRLYLIGTLLLSFVIPLAEIEIIRPATTASSEFTELASAGRIMGTLSAGGADLTHEFIPETEAPANWYTIIGLVYIAASCLMLMRLIYVIITIMWYARNGEFIDGFRLVQPNDDFRNCSFFNVLFIDQPETSHGSNEILVAHEKEHARRLHSIDKLLIEISRCLLWANPAIYFYRHVLNEVHEYEVDEAAANKFDKREYASFLVAMSVGRNVATLNGMSSGSLKSRVQMMFTEPSHKMKKSFYLLAVPLIGGMISLFTVKVVYANALSDVKASSGELASVLSAPATAETATRNAVKAPTNTKTEPILAATQSGKFRETIERSKRLGAPGQETAAPIFTSEKRLRVILDPGHGGKDHGGKALGTNEKDITLETALRLKNILEGKGVVVQLTREADEFVRLKDRALQGSGGADMLISLHMQMAKQKREETNGIQVLFSNLQEHEETREKSISLANRVYEKLVQQKDLVVRENLNADLMVLRASKIPAVLLELGFMTNQNDLSLVKDDRYLGKIANVIREAGRGI